MEESADLDAAADEILPGRVDVVDHELQALNRARLGGGQALPEGDRAGRMRGRQLDHPEVVADDDVSVQPPSLVSALAGLVRNNRPPVSG